MITVMPINATSNCCDALMFEVDENGIAVCSDCREYCEAVGACIYCNDEGETETMHLRHDGEVEYYTQKCICQI